MSGDEVVITRHGKSIAELRAIDPEPRRSGAFDWLRRQRQSRPGSPVSSIELLRQIYEDDG